MEAVQTHRWTREEVERMAEAGVFHPEARIELIDGEVVEMSPQKSRHATAVRLAEEVLRGCFREGFDVRAQLPLALSPQDLLEPDVAVVPGHLRDYTDAHPAEAVLVVEVADTSLDYDRQRKLLRYARAGVPEYWIVNLIDGCVEVYRDPSAETYRTKQTLEAESRLAPAARPDTNIDVRELLP